MGSSKWAKAKMALGLKLNSCLYFPRTLEDSPVEAPSHSAARFSGSATSSPKSPADSGHRVRMPTTPTPSSSGLRLPKHSSGSSKKICAICLANLKSGYGLAIFTAECSHSFHFHCITSNVKYGKQNCPVCRAEWKEVPFQTAASMSKSSSSLNHALPANARRLPSPRGVSSRNADSLFHATEPGVYDDDDEVTNDVENICNGSSKVYDHQFMGDLEVETYPELPAVPRSKSHDNFSILIHLKAPLTTGGMLSSEKDGSCTPLIPETSRAPVDLVTVLDVSGSMAGTKLALLKRAMGFVIQALGPSDRLSVIAFSSTARRLFPLRRMTETGRHEALQAINSLTSKGGTNIAEALRKGAKVMTDRKWKNPFSSIMLLSDGQDTYTINHPRGSTKTSTNYQSLLPDTMHRDTASSLHIPVHAFGFGTDHDAVSMHSISETSGGTFSFIEAEGVIQDAFAQCIGGLLSVVVQEVIVEVECIDPELRLISIKSGSYKTILTPDGRNGKIDIGDLYAEEERDFLVTIDVPVNGSRDEMQPLLKVKCTYKHPISKLVVNMDCASEVRILRPEEAGTLSVSMEVDKQRNRILSAEAMAEARASAEQGDLTRAVSVLEHCRKILSETVSALAGDQLCAVLDAELHEMQERMANRQVYETSGRAYVLSGLSSHSWQRATARGDSTDHTNLVQTYQTPSMVDMVNLSQTFGSTSSARPKLRPTKSFPARPHPR